MAVKLQYSAGVLSVSCRKPASCRQREIKMAETNKSLCRSSTDVLDQSDIQLLSRCHATQLLSIC